MGELSPPLSTKITLARSGLGLLRQADRASAACSCPRHAVESSSADCADCAELCGTGKCDCCCGSAVWARAGDCATVHSDGGPGAGGSEVCCDEANVSQVSSLVRTLPMFRTAQTSTASKQMTDLHRSLGTPQGWTTVQRGWSPPRCCAAGEEMRIPDANGSDCALPQYTLLFYSILYYTGQKGHFLFTTPVQKPLPV